jgi:hypothetical protein
MSESAMDCVVSCDRAAQQLPIVALARTKKARTLNVISLFYQLRFAIVFAALFQLDCILQVKNYPTFHSQIDKYETTDSVGKSHLYVYVSSSFLF